MNSKFIIRNDEAKRLEAGTIQKTEPLNHSSFSFRIKLNSKRYANR